MTTLQRKLESFHARRVEAPPEPLADIQVPIARRVQVQKDFILTLNYKEREYRESAISSPYDKTFQWMFNDDPNRKNAEFSQWLASDSSLFWITGKPGSGKSTLMKYISDFKSEGEGAALCRQQLLAWAGSSELLTASFYFWASGSAAQGSQKAMLSSLLFQLLQDNPDIIARIAPAVWESACLFNTQIRKVWTEEDLSEILLNAVKQLSGRKLKTCFFIDGLDEFDGKPETLISFIHRIVELPNVKVCVSSRPWVQFEDAFGRKPSLRVQDLTYGDIKHFVESQFDRNEGFRRLKSREAKYAQSLTHQIVDKSAGVFLWVRIVVQSLLAGLTNDDRVRDLESRLHSLPPDLEQLYDKILDDLDPFYFDHACQYFQLMLVHNGPTRALLLSFADEEDVDFPNRLPVRALRRHKAAARIQTLRRRLNSRCKGLLEIGASGGVERVNFLHRTVREYLDRPDIRSKIDSVLHKVQFDSHMELCSAYLSMLKADPEISTDMAQQQRQRDSSLQGCLYWGSKAVGTSQKARLLRLMHSLHKVLKFHPELLPPKTYRDCTVSGSLTIEEHPGMHSFSGDGFLNLVTRFGIVEYLESRVPSGALSRLKCQFFSDDWLWETSLSDRLTLAYITGVTRLSGMIHRGTKSITEGSPLPLLLDACLCFPPNAAVFQCLLEKGADFNQVMRIPLLRLQLVGASHRNAGVTFLTDKASLLAVVVAAAIMTTMNEAYNLREKKRADGMDAWEVWDKWIEVLKVFVEYGAEIDEKLARTVSRGLQDVSLDFKSEKLMWYVLRDIFNNRYRPANWWDLWYDWSSGSEYYTDDSM
ncbi:hypothetical protein B0T16DRAFT_361557 [Cercophora newfieldiana]|uniref:NACHT domain-containing protein n=1 Tax=Cercophora newfieldiana TaxID=92897 RepID=A0AA39XUI3_9PEZI|nr:hypothetical protein B0T16DRAFT_361557 [Cercophora newfieldiana]